MNIDTAGIQDGYWDVEGGWHPIAPETHRAILAAMGVEDAGEVAAGEDAVRVLYPGDLGRWTQPGGLTLEDGTPLRIAGPLPPDLPWGYHDFRPDGTDRPVRLIVTPGECLVPEPTWGWATQLYAARSHASWGIGDFADLRELARWSAELGAGLLMFNPFSADCPVLPQQPSPYYPTSRRFLNPLYLRIEEIPGAGRLGPALEKLAAAGRALSAKREIDRDAVFHLKMEGLRSLWAGTNLRSVPDLRSVPAGDATFDEDFEEYCRRRQAELGPFATYCALAVRFGGDWRTWSGEYRDPKGPAVRQFADEHRQEVRFHQWLQWLLERQLAAAAEVLPLVQDLPVGFSPGGADAWVWQDLLAKDCTIGAPPDAFNRAGQDWAMPPFVPHRLRAAGYEPLAQTLRAVLWHAGGLRIDHVMGLFRLYWIPQGLGPGRGAYVRYRGDELLGILALESRRAGAFVVGEDLGTVEDETRRRLAECRALSFRVLWFEPRPPTEYPQRAMAAVTTHDLPTIAGLLSGQDLAAQRAAGVPNDRAMEELRQHLGRLVPMAPDATIHEVIEATYQRLGQSPSLLLVATLEDALAVPDRPNMPGTITQYPNWSLALPGGIEALRSAELPRRIAAALAPGEGGRVRRRLSAVSYQPSAAIDAVDLLHAHQEQAPIRDRGRGVVAVAQVVGGEDFELRPGLDHEALAGVGIVDVALRIGDGAGPGRGDAVEPRGVDLLAGGGLPALEDAGRVEAIDVSADDDRRADPFRQLGHRPLDVGLGHVAGAGRVHGHADAPSPAIEVHQPGAKRRRRGVARPPAPPEAPARGRIEALQGAIGNVHARGQHEHLRLGAGLDHDGRAVAERGAGEHLPPFHLAAGPVVGDHARIAALGHGAEQDQRAVVEDRAAAERHVEGVGDDLFSPNDLPLEIHGRDDRGAERAVDQLAVGGRRGTGISAAGPAAEISAQPRPGRHERVPEDLAVVGVVTEEVVFGDDLGAVLDARRPEGRGDEDAALPDDRAGVTLAAERGPPEDVFALGPAPAERQAAVLGVAEPRRAAETGPILAPADGRAADKKCQPGRRGEQGPTFHWWFLRFACFPVGLMVQGETVWSTVRVLIHPDWRGENDGHEEQMVGLCTLGGCGRAGGCVGGPAGPRGGAEAFRRGPAEDQSRAAGKGHGSAGQAEKILLFGRCEGFNHAGGILAGNTAFKLMGEKTGAFTTAESTDMASFEPDTLNQFDAVVFNNTTALKFGNPAHRKALLAFVNGGKGIVGVHSAVDNFYKWPEGAAVMGALFTGHPWGRCAVRIDDPRHPLTKAFDGKGFYISEEMYRMGEPYSREKLRVLVSMDLSHMTQKDDEVGRKDKDNPIAWIHEVGKGREFYCSFGHDRPIFFNKAINQFYLDGIQYAIGDLKADATPSAKLASQPTPALAPEKQ